MADHTTKCSQAMAFVLPTIADETNCTIDGAASADFFSFVAPANEVQLP